ncbi:MAG TPA: PEP-CTERM/exosortase system-associated acyltransferase [Candidatus Acidoferrum sp.]|nr:PEP-CTERM/exosortase system-associated acyltransferase [Candidatus Acidoferrum sp.]
MHDSPPPDLADSFRRYFTLMPALSDEQRRATYRIRHDVYCRDLAWEPLRPDGQETDDYDRHSAACLMRAAQNDSLVGCLRLVLCRPEDPAYPLPLERACAGTLDRNRFDPSRLDRHRIAEVSRLAVERDYRRRKGEANQPVAIDTSDFGDTSHQRFPFIPVGLYLSAFAMAAQLGIDHLLVLTEPRLARHLGRIGLDIQPIGGAIEHRGERIPSVMDTRATIANLHPMMHRMWKQIHAWVEDAFVSAGADAVPWRSQLAGIETLPPQGIIVRP